MVIVMAQTIEIVADRTAPPDAPGVRCVSGAASRTPQDARRKPHADGLEDAASRTPTAWRTPAEARAGRCARKGKTRRIVANLADDRAELLVVQGAGGL
ncbi:hypothetical protein HD597_001808 [Nonomuraea thailandensis]|uniref:Uncharacterized protein n=1 Tax=Nonomuraea thailandensis TaxID=1188745 RepID=A0A9X2JZF3_9ACTN|nr:hypothetical protein [Nonomuraea thailandensis]MCP2354788.1 hypothetical protein [Nonomuraea thailandensis]